MYKTDSKQGPTISRGNYAQNYVTTYQGKISEKEYTYQFSCSGCLTLQPHGLHTAH